MGAKHIVIPTLNNRRRGRTDWSRVDALTDHQIRKAVRSDSDAAPILDKKWFETAKLVMPELKVPVSLRIDRESDWSES